MVSLYNTGRWCLLYAIALLFAVQAHGQHYIEIIENAKGKNFNEVVQLVEAYYANRFKGKGSGYKQFKRWEDFHRARLDENGIVVNVAQQTLIAAMNERRKRSQARVISDSPGNWQGLGPQTSAWPNHSGRVNCIAVDPANPAIIYAGTPSGGLWRSVDDGQSWQCLTDHLTSAIGVTSIVINPSSPADNRTLYILTGDRPLGTVNSLGILKSVDNGASWQTTNAPLSHPVYKLMMHPINHNVLFYANGSGIMKSLDGGISWRLKVSGRFTDFEFHPANPAIMHAVGQSGTFRTTDGGETWQSVATGPANSFRAELAVTPANPAYVYLFAGGDFDYSGLYKSTDHGQTFTKVPSAYRMSRQYWYNMALAVSPHDPNTLYAGEVYSYKSTDGGLNWTSAQLHHVDHHALEFFNGYLYVGNDGGVVRQNLMTGQVDDLSAGLAITQMYRIGHNPQNSAELVFGSQDNGTSLLMDADAKRFGGGDGMECFYNHSIPTFVYNSSQYGALRRLDRSYSFTHNQGINPPGTYETGDWVTPFVADPTNGNIIYAGFRDVWRSTDRGDNWVNLTAGTTGTSNASVLAVAPSDSNVIYVVKAGNYLYRSTDGGQTWTRMQTSGSLPYISSITIHPDNPDIIWGTGGGFGSGTGNTRVGKSTDGGQTWTNVTGSLPNIGVNCAVYQRNTANGLYVGTDLGVYYKDDTMSEWVSFDRGMPYVIVRDLEINEAEGKIFAGTYGRGAFVSDLYGASDVAYPVVRITHPEEQDTFTAPATVSFTASATDTDGSIVRVEFYSGSRKLGEDTTSPYAYSWTNVSVGNYLLIAKATDNDGLISADSVNIVVTDGTACSGSGKILHEVWTSVSGNDVASIPVYTAPSSSSELAVFEIPANAGDNYGTRVRGYICAPQTGAYTFWISSNDHSELWLSPDNDPVKKSRIAFVTGYTNARQWDKFTTQRSAAVELVAGRRYYIEALHKEGVGMDHMAVGWQLPDGALERPVQGARLIPYGTIPDNNDPVVTITDPEENETFVAPATIDILADASDSDGNVVKVEFFNGSSKLGEDLTAPYGYVWTDVAAGSYTVIATATDNDGGSSSASAVITVTEGTACAGSGKILREVWTGVSGTSVASIPVNTTPSSSSELTIFEIPANAGDNYGTRVRGYVCVQETGPYTFWISSNDHSELWLSDNAEPAGKTRIAFVTGYTNVRQWDKYATQKSAVINLVAGQRYYIEALHKEGVGTDHMAVGWQLPDGTLERPIQGDRLIPYGASDENSNPVVVITSPENGESFIAPASINITASASDSDGNVARVEFFNGQTKLGEDASSPYNFSWTSVPAGNYTLMARATDNDGGTASASVQVTVIEAIACAADGRILRELWTNVSGSDVASIPVGTAPSSRDELTIFELPSNIGDNYGTRVRGYLCVPDDGEYVFWISSNDHSELWLSADDDPAGKARIAFVTGATSPREWNRFSSQQSVPISLQAGTKYYIEALHKEGVGTDHMAVGWQLPDGTLERPIGGDRLSPYIDAFAATPSDNGLMYSAEESADIQLFPNPYKEGTLTMMIAPAILMNGNGNARVSIQILTAAGDEVFAVSVDCGSGCEGFNIPLSESLPSGMYVVKATLGRKKYWSKLMVN